MGYKWACKTTTFCWNENKISCKLYEELIYRIALSGHYVPGSLVHFVLISDMLKTAFYLQLTTHIKKQRMWWIMMSHVVLFFWKIGTIFHMSGTQDVDPGTVGDSAGVRGHPPANCCRDIGLESFTVDDIWVRSWNCGCLVTWFCYQLIAKPGNKTAAVSCLTHINLPHVFINTLRANVNWSCTLPRGQIDGSRFEYQRY